MISDEEHARVTELVYAHDYYVDTFNTVRKYYIERNMKMNTPYFWNDFWIELPNIAAIRRAPFWDVCSLAEEIFNYDAAGDL